MLRNISMGTHVCAIPGCSSGMQSYSHGAGDMRAHKSTAHPVFCRLADCAEAPLMRRSETPELDAVKEAGEKLPLTTTWMPTGAATSTSLSALAGSLYVHACTAAEGYAVHARRCTIIWGTWLQCRFWHHVRPHSRAHCASNIML